MKVSGNPYGGSFVSRSSAAPDDVALEACRLQGARLARTAGYLASGLAQEAADQDGARVPAGVPAP
jgi:NAD(P)H dehydrogenase (quinone)